MGYDGKAAVAPPSRGLPVVMGGVGPGLTEVLMVLGAVVVWLCAGTAALATALGW